jgi:hypothetical protein
MAPLRRQELNTTYAEARLVAFQGPNSRAGWTRTGIYPYQPSRVLECPQVVNMTRVRPELTPPPLSSGPHSTPNTIRAVEEADEAV